MAEFLSEGVEGKPEEQGEDLIRKLVRPEAPPVRAAVVPPKEEQVTGLDQAAIEQLVQVKPAPEPERKVEPAGGATPDLDRSVIDGLLGEGKDKDRKKDGTT
jgi:hypothetical protein